MDVVSLGTCTCSQSTSTQCPSKDSARAGWRSRDKTEVHREQEVKCKLTSGAAAVPRHWAACRPHPTPQPMEGARFLVIIFTQ